MLILMLQNGDESLQLVVIDYIIKIINDKKISIDKYVPILVRLSQSIEMGIVLYKYANILASLSITVLILILEFL